MMDVGGEESQKGSGTSQSSDSNSGSSDDSSSSGSEALLSNISKIEQEQIKLKQARNIKNPEDDPYFITADKLTVNPINENAG